MSSLIKPVASPKIETFPIPMRGNEVCPACGHRHSGPDRFPIPMRGNEDGLVGKTADLSIEFPILMRGNETVEQSNGTDITSEFPIPMRGNEILRVCQSMWMQIGVPNPHEG